MKIRNKSSSRAHQTIDIKKLENKYPLMYDVLNVVAKEFAVNPDKFLMLLREKRSGNDLVHVDHEIRRYTQTHKIKQILI
jgi:hypothetical protein